MFVETLALSSGALLYMKWDDIKFRQQWKQVTFSQARFTNKLGKNIRLIKNVHTHYGADLTIQLPYGYTYSQLQNDLDIFKEGLKFKSIQTEIKDNVVLMKCVEKQKDLKSAPHPVLNKKVYYTKKMPSYHRLISNDIQVSFKGQLKTFKREYDIDGVKVDTILVLKNGKIIIFEVDIYNRTSKDKISRIFNSFKQNNMPVDLFIVTRKQRKEQGEVGVEDVDKIARQYSYK